MSRVGMRRFLETANTEPSVRQAFADAVTAIAQKQGFDVTQDDVARVINELASKAPPSGSGGDVTTLAMGEEEKIPFPEADPDQPTVTTLALGEEEKIPNPSAPQTPDDNDGMMVTCAIPEEGPR